MAAAQLAVDSALGDPYASDAHEDIMDIFLVIAVLAVLAVGQVLLKQFKSGKKAKCVEGFATFSKLVGDNAVECKTWTADNTQLGSVRKFVSGSPSVEILEKKGGPDISAAAPTPSQSDAASPLGCCVDEPCSNDSASFDANFHELASRRDLAACWRLWHSQSPQAVLSNSSCIMLASALLYTADPADANSALDVALVSKNSCLADAAFAAGARLCESAWLINASARLLQEGLPRKSSHLVDIARAHGRECRGDLAVDLWCSHAGSLVSEAPGVLPEPELYGVALEACARSSDFDSAARLVSVTNYCAPPSGAGQVAMLALARWLARRQGVTLARKCTAAVREAGGQVDFLTLRAMLASSARSGDMTQAKELFNELECAGFSPSSETYSTLIRGFCAAGNIEQGLVYLHTMKSQGIVPEVALYNAVLAVCASRNMLGLAEDLVAEMETLGLRPTGNTLASMVRLFGDRGQLSRALEVFADFPYRHGFEPDSIAYHALVSACLVSGHLDVALDTFAKMTSAGFIASARTYEALIDTCMRRGELGSAVHLVADALGLASTETSPSTPAVAQADGSEMPAPARRRAMVEPRVVEELLRLIGRRGEADRLGLPLLGRLRVANYEVSERVVLGVHRAADQSASPSVEGELQVQTSLQARREARRAEWARWRCDFTRSSSTALTG